VATGGRICDADSNRLDELKSLYPGVNTQSDYQQLLENQEIKGVVIATPAGLHHSMAKEALLAGKDTFVEKPFTTSSADAEELLELSERQRRVLMDIYYLYSTRVNLGQIRLDEDALWRLVPHDIAAFNYLLGEAPTVVSAQGSSYLRPDSVDVVFVTLRFGKVLAHVHASWLDPHKTRQLTVIGSQKMGVFDDTETEYKLRLYDKGVINDTALIRSGEVLLPHLSLTEPLFLECQDFVKCVTEGKQPLSDAKQALEVVKALETAAQLMQEEGRQIPVGKGLH